MALSLLSRVTIGEVIADKHELVQVYSDTLISKCLDILNQKQILAVPVLDKVQGTYIGIVDVFDIMRFTALGFFEDRLYNDKLFEDFTFAGETAKDLIDKSARSQKMFVLSFHENILDTIKLMTEHKLHRVLVRFPTKLYDQKEKSSGSLFRVLSQSDLVKYLFEKLPHLFKDVPLSQLGIKHNTEQIAAICLHQTALEGFLKMFDNEVNAVAIIEDEDSKLVANLSASDLLGLGPTEMKSIKLPVLEFLKSRGSEKRGLISCREDENLFQAVDKITKAKVHRAWIVDANGKLLGVLTLTDILRIFFSLAG